MGSGWGPVNSAPRLAILEAMPEHDGDDTPHVSSAEIAKAVGKHQGTVDQMLQALRADRLVDCASTTTGHRKWWRTEAPIPQTFTSTAALNDAQPYNDLALRQALGMSTSPPPVRGPTRVVKAK